MTAAAHPPAGRGYRVVYEPRQSIPPVTSAAYMTLPGRFRVALEFGGDTFDVHHMTASR